jgi:predicted DNA binding CopG/RHH family protein
MPKASPEKVTNSIYEISNFKTEREAAEWWYGNRERLDDLLVKHGRIVPGRKVERTRAVSIRLPEVDIQLAQQLANDRGIGYQTLLKDVIRKGLRK